MALNTVARLLLDAGNAAAAHHHERVQGIEGERTIECDEIWSYVYAKQKNLGDAQDAPRVAGNVWTWTALDRESKLIVSYLLSGGRDSDSATQFMVDLSRRLKEPPLLVTDALANGFSKRLEKHAAMLALCRRSRSDEDRLLGKENHMIADKSFFETNFSLEDYVVGIRVDSPVSDTDAGRDREVQALCLRFCRISGTDEQEALESRVNTRRNFLGQWSDDNGPFTEAEVLDLRRQVLGLRPREVTRLKKYRKRTPGRAD